MSAQVTEAHKALTESVCELLDSEEMVGPSPAEQAAQLIADSEAKAVVEIAMVAAESANRNVSLRLEREYLRADRDYNHKCINRLASATGTLGEKSERVVEVALSTIDQLRAEVERLKPYVSKAVLTHEGTMLCSPLVAVKFNEQATRAERAEAEVERLTAEVGMLRGYDCGAMQEAEDGPTPDGECGVCIKCLRARAERAEADLHALRLICGTTDADKFSTWVDRANARADEAEHDCRVLISRLNVAEAELADIRALANRRNKRDHSQDTTHQLVAALDQALDIAQAELAAERARVDQLILTHPLYDSRDQLDAAMREGGK